MLNDPKFWQVMMYIIITCIFISLLVAMTFAIGYESKDKSLPRFNPNERLNQHRLRLHDDHDEDYDDLNEEDQ